MSGGRRRLDLDWEPWQRMRIARLGIGRRAVIVRCRRTVSIRRQLVRGIISGQRELAGRPAMRLASVNVSPVKHIATLLLCVKLCVTRV